MEIFVLRVSCFFFSSRRRHTRCALVTGVQTCALPILAVDDSRATLEMLGEQLSRRGFLVVQCGDGGEALDLLAARGVDLVLLDMVMPGLPGLQDRKSTRLNSSH